MFEQLHNISAAIKETESAIVREKHQIASQHYMLDPDRSELHRLEDRLESLKRQEENAFNFN